MGDGQGFGEGTHTHRSIDSRPFKPGRALIYLKPACPAASAGVLHGSFRVSSVVQRYKNSCTHMHE